MPPQIKFGLPPKQRETASKRREAHAVFTAKTREVISRIPRTFTSSNTVNIDRIKVEEHDLARPEIVQVGTPQSVTSGSVPLHKVARELNEFIITQLSSNREYDLAISMTKRALALMPGSHELWSNLGTHLWNLRRYDEAVEALKKSLELKPDYGCALGNMGLVLSSLRRDDEAIEYYTKAMELPAHRYGAQWNRSLTYLAQGNYETGFREYESRIKFRADTVYVKFASPAWKGEDLKGKTIYLSPEQGIGDTIIYSRFIPWFARLGGRILFTAKPELQSLLWDFRHLVEFLPVNVTIPGVDYHVWMASLPFHYGLTQENIPPDPGFINDIVERQMPLKVQIPEPLGKAGEIIRVGICWTGNPFMDRNPEREIPFNLISDLVSDPRVWLYSLQVGDASKEISKHHAERLIVDLSDQLKERGLTGTGTVMKQMDLIITCCTSVAHLAGALGIPCWVMLCYDPFWFWMHERRDSPWWPSVRLFRQTRPGDWGNVIEEVKSELALFHSKR